MHADQLCVHHKISCCQAIDVQLGLAIDSPKATLAVKRRLACEMVKCWQQVRIDSISMLVLSCIFFWLCVSWLCRGQGMFSQGLVSTRCKKSWKLIKFPLSKKGSIIDRCHCFFCCAPNISEVLRCFYLSADSVLFCILIQIVIKIGMAKWDILVSPWTSTCEFTLSTLLDLPCNVVLVYSCFPPEQIHYLCI